MSRPTGRRTLFAALVWLAGCDTATADDIQVNTYTLFSQRFASVSLDADGDCVIVWHSGGSAGTDSSGYSIQGQRYASDGSLAGDEFQVNTFTTDWQQYPSVSSNAGGDFVVVWDSYDGSGGNLLDIKAQRYTSDGSRVGGEFQVNSHGAMGVHRYPSVSLDADGDFVVVWRGSPLSEVHGQRFASDGSRLGGQFQISTYAAGTQESPAVSMDADGDFVVVWTSDEAVADPLTLSVQARRYSSDGSALADEFQVNTYSTDSQRNPSVSLDADGDFFVVWESFGSSGPDSDVSIQGQRYSSPGFPIGGEFQVNTYTTGSQRHPSVSLDTDGDSVVVWFSYASEGPDQGPSIQGQRYNSDGSQDGSEFQVNTYTTEFQLRPSVSLDADGDFVIVWHSYGSSGTDSSAYSVQRTEVPLFVDGFESGDACAWSSINP